MKYAITKTYDHNLGLSTVFRQWKATSHCKYFHGYALGVKLTFEAEELNKYNWVIDFGSLKPVKQWLKDTFDHKTLIAKDDPALPLWSDLNEAKSYNRPKLIDMVIIPKTGCEGFAEYIAHNVQCIIRDNNVQGLLDNEVALTSVEVREHGANSAIFFPSNGCIRDYSGTYA